MKQIYLLLAFIVFAFHSNAQNELVNGGGAIYVQPGAMLHVQGTFTNALNSTYENDGILELDGDFINNGNAAFNYSPSVPSTDRAVKFTGSVKQHIVGNINTTNTQSFYNLVINQASADTVEMQANALVQGSLVFGNSSTTTTYTPSGTVNAGTGLLKTFESNSNPAQRYLLSVENGDVDAVAGYPSLIINGAPATGFVLTQGTIGDTLSGFTGLQRNISSAASYVFPIGTIAHGYSAVRANFTTLTGGAGQDVVAQFNDSTSNTNGYEGNLGEYCNVCGTGNIGPPDNSGFNYFFTSNPCFSGNPLWVILEQTTKKHGFWSLVSTTNSSAYQYWVEMFPNSFADDGSPVGLRRILKYSPGGTALNDYYYDPTNQDWTSQILSSISTADDLLTYSLNTNCYTGSGIPGGLYTGFSQFGIFSENSNDALPITLLSLTATPINNSYIMVSWSTSEEINNAGFALLRSADGLKFDSLGWVQGAGSSTVSRNYSFNDNTAVAGVVYYYKLNQYNLNGGITPSNIVSATLTGNGAFDISGFIPNPARDVSMLVVSVPVAQNIEIKLYSLLGRELSDKTYDLSAGNNDIYLNTESLQDATYTAVINSAYGVYSRKLAITGN